LTGKSPNRFQIIFPSPFLLFLLDGIFNFPIISSTFLLHLEVTSFFRW